MSAHIWVPICLALLTYSSIAILAVWAPNCNRYRVIALSATIGFMGWTVAAFQDKPVPPEMRVHGMCFILVALGMTMRAIELTVSTPRPLHRRQDAHDGNASPDASCPSNLISAALEAIELMTNLRGIGWSHSKGLIIARETRPLKRVPFLLHCLGGMSARFIVFDIVKHTMSDIYPSIASPTGSSIYDPTLPPLLRYSQSTVLTLWVGLSAYLTISATYLFVTIAGVLIFRQSPKEWPPLFDAPWRATSISEFWNQRWHQLFRRTFIVLGTCPVHAVFPRPGIIGRAASVLGIFLVSGVLHDLGVWGMRCGFATRQVTGFFVINGVGVLLEEAWKRSASGRDVRGWMGWLWTFVWIVGWAHMLVEAWMTRGLAGFQVLPDEWSVGYAFVRWFFV